MEAERVAFVCNNFVGMKLSRTYKNEENFSNYGRISSTREMKLKLNAQVEYMCTHTTLCFLQKRSMLVPEGKFVHCHVYMALHTSCFSEVLVAYAWLVVRRGRTASC